MLKTLLAGVGLTSIALAAAVAINAGYYPGDDRPQSLKVNYAAFDLRTPQGVALLERRIDDAITRVCGDGSSRFRWNPVDEDCARDAWEGTRPQIARAIANARSRHHRWTSRPVDWHERFEDAAPAAEPAVMPGRPEFGPPPLHRGGVLGGPIDDRIGAAFQSGDTVTWRDHGWHGIVQVSEAREYGRSICRTVSIVRRADGAWETVRGGPVCLRPDGTLHNGD